MKNILIATALSAVMHTTPAIAADAGVSVSIGQPGFYGRIDIGDYPYPQPRVIYPQPRVVERVYVESEPIYMHVPPGHARNWRKYCYKYSACGERVYFVQDSWYNQEYARAIGNNIAITVTGDGKTIMTIEKATMPIGEITIVKIKENIAS